ncbi:MAG TPA: hypothetical protein VEX35_08170 [Allosphingosinicella sp.]|nr:hypothetical protein [Allosphingosinicella sp.]
MRNPELASLADALARTRHLLQQHGDTFTAQRLHDLEDRLNRGEHAAISPAVSEATGGIGSLNDRFLCVENGDAIEKHEEAKANACLRALVEEVEQRARAAATAHDIHLSR